MFYEEDEGFLRIAVAKVIEEETLSKVRKRPGEEIADYVFQKGKTVILNDGLQNDPKFAFLSKSENILSFLTTAIQ